MLPSPCINICQMDKASGLCLGCFRTIAEITVWSRTDDEHRARILATIARRREQNVAQGDKASNGCTG